MKKIKMWFELIYIFIIPLLIMLLTLQIQTINTYDENNNILTTEKTLEVNDMSFLREYNDNITYKNYLNFNQLIVDGNFTIDSWRILSAGNYTISNNICSINWFANYTRNGIGQTFNYNINHKYLCCATIKNNLVDEARTFTIGQSYGAYVTKTIEPNETESVIGIITILQNSGQGYVEFAISGYNTQLTYDANISNVMCIDLTKMFGSGYEPTTYEELSNYIDLSEFYDFTESNIIIYKSNNIISENHEYNYTWYTKVFNNLFDGLQIEYNIVLQIIITYTILWIIMFIIWHALYSPFDKLLHLLDKKE